MNNVILYKDVLNFNIDGYIGVEYANIASIDNSINNIYCYDILDKLDIHDQNLLLKNLAERISPICKVILQGPDIKQLCLAVSHNKINILKAQQILYSRIITHSLSNIEDILISNNYNIIHKKYINIFEYYIESTYEK